MSPLPAIDRIALAEVRMLKEAQSGALAPLRALMEPHLPGIWSICRGYFDDDEPATDLAIAFRDTFHGRVRELVPDQPFGLQLYRMLWRFLVHDLELDPAAPLPPLVPPAFTALPDPIPAAPLRAAIAEVPPIPRLVYLFWLVTDLDAGRLAELLDLPEITTRRARALAVWTLFEASTP